MDTASISYRVHQCSECPGDTAFICESCSCHLCPRCKDIHVTDLETADHNVVSYRSKSNYILSQNSCLRHPTNVYVNYCKHCKLPICCHCTDYRKYRTLGVTKVYRKKRKQTREIFHTIRSETLFYRPLLLLPGIKAKIKTCHKKISLHQSKMITKAKTLTKIIDIVKRDFMITESCDFDFKHRCVKQKMKITKYITSLQRYVHKYEQSANYPLKFLSSIKTAQLPQIHITLHTSRLFMTESLNKESLMKSLIGSKRMGRKFQLFIPSSELLQSHRQTVVRCCYN